MKNDKELLIDLLLDLESKEFQAIQQQANAVNIFNVLKLTRAEIRHSNLLAWLLDPNENHKLGASFSKYFLYEIFNKLKDLEDCHFDFGKLFLESIDNFIIYRERFNIDILMVAENQLVCIENKIDSYEHNQLKTYETRLASQYPNHEKLFLYLTPNDEIVSDKNSNWHEISYQPVSIAIQKILDTAQLNQETEILLNNYQSIIKGEIMNEDTTIEKLCLEIYRKHKPAFDLIDKYRPDDDLTISEAVVNFLQNRQDIVYDGFNLGKNLIRFTTQAMKDLFPNATPNKKSPWANGYAFMYEIHLWSGKIAAVFAHPIYQNEKLQNDFEQKFTTVFDRSQKYNQVFGIQKKNKSLKSDWQFYTAFCQQLVDKNNYHGNLEDLIETIKTKLEHFIEHDLKDFETKIKPC